MKLLYRTLPVFIVLWIVWCWQTPAPAQDLTHAPVAAQATSLFDPGIMEFIKVFGLGGMIFTIWLFDYRRQRSLESIIEQYDQRQQEHLEAFKDINGRNISTFKEAMSSMQRVAEDAQSTAILCAQVNTKVAERLDFLSKGGSHD